MTFCTGVVPRALPPERDVEHPKIGGNKIADGQTCQVGPTGVALW